MVTRRHTRPRRSTGRKTGKGMSMTMGSPKFRANTESHADRKKTVSYKLRHKRNVNFSGKYIKTQQKNNIKYRDKEIALNNKLNSKFEERRELIVKLLGTKNTETKTYKKNQAKNAKLGLEIEKLITQAKEAREKHIKAYKDYNYALEDNYYVKSDRLEEKIQRLEAENKKDYTFKREVQINRAKKFNNNLKQEAKLYHKFAENYTGES